MTLEEYKKKLETLHFKTETTKQYAYECSKHEESMELFAPTQYETNKKYSMVIDHYALALLNKLHYLKESEKFLSYISSLGENAIVSRVYDTKKFLKQILNKAGLKINGNGDIEELVREKTYIPKLKYDDER